MEILFLYLLYFTWVVKIPLWNIVNIILLKNIFWKNICSLAYLVQEITLQKTYTTRTLEWCEIHNMWDLGMYIQDSKLNYFRKLGYSILIRQDTIYYITYFSFIEIFLSNKESFFTSCCQKILVQFILKRKFCFQNIVNKLYE